jgi:hypothetical protein
MRPLLKTYCQPEVAVLGLLEDMGLRNLPAQFIVFQTN